MPAAPWIPMTVALLCGAASALAQSAPPASSSPDSRFAVAPANRTVTSAKEHERQLQAIRQALLDATIERPTKVISSAWVDDKGVLHESAHFHSQAQVQGVRVLSYLQGDESGTARVSAEVLPWGLKNVRAPKGSCEAPPKAWRLPMRLQAQLSGGFTGAQQHASHALLSSASRIWHSRLAQSKRWLSQEATPVASNTYMQLLSGEEQAVAGWVAQLSLSPQPAGAPERNAWLQRLPWAEPVWHWTLRIAVGRQTSPDEPVQPVWSAHQNMTIPVNELSNQPGGVLPPLQKTIEEQMTRWIAELEQSSQCDPVQFSVVRQPGQVLMLQAGQGSGLRPGDRVLLMNPAHVPSRLLEAGATDHLALAEVVRIGRHQTELQLLAGPALPPQGQWVALPL